MEELLFVKCVPSCTCCTGSMMEASLSYVIMGASLSYVMMGASLSLCHDGGKPELCHDGGKPELCVRRRSCNVGGSSRGQVTREVMQTMAECTSAAGHTGSSLMP